MLKGGDPSEISSRSKPRHHLYLSSNFWDGLWIVQQPTCNEIQAEEPVLYVERFVSLLTVLRYPRLWRRLFTWLLGARHVTRNLKVLAPLPLFHAGHRFPRLFRFEFALQRRWILWHAGRPPICGRILWLDNPLYECAVGRMGERAAVYHVADEMTQFPTSHARVLSRLEERLLRRATVVFAAAEQLARAKERVNPQTYTILNAIDTSAFAHDLSPEEQAEIDAIPMPRVGFIGVLDTWVNLPLLVQVANDLKEVSLVVVGVSRVDDQVLRAMPNVHVLGRRNRRSVPGILRRVSASLVPFLQTPLTERTLPLKVFEALAAGTLPVCTAFSPELETLEREGRLLIGHSPDEFVHFVQKAIVTDSPARREALAKFGLQQTWTARWCQMDAVLRRDVPGNTDLTDLQGKDCR